MSAFKIPAGQPSGQDVGSPQCEHKPEALMTMAAEAFTRA